MTLRDLDDATKKRLLGRLLCGRGCFACGQFVDYTGECKLNYLFESPEWIEYSSNHDEWILDDIVSEMNYQGCLLDARASGIHILYEDEFNRCSNCKIIKACLHPEKGNLITKVRKEF